LCEERQALTHLTIPSLIIRISPRKLSELTYWGGVNFEQWTGVEHATLRAWMGSLNMTSTDPVPLPTPSQSLDSLSSMTLKGPGLWLFVIWCFSGNSPTFSGNSPTFSGDPQAGFYISPSLRKGTSHYYVDRVRLGELMREIENGKFFFLVAPRQSGKSTTMLQLASQLDRAKYLYV